MILAATSGGQTSTDWSLMFTQQHLQQVGFEGFAPFVHDLAARIPDTPGVYVVLWNGSDEPQVQLKSTGGRFKGREPSVPAHKAEPKLTLPTPTLYIGQTTKSLRDRIELLRRFGRGSPSAIGEAGISGNSPALST